MRAVFAFLFDCATVSLALESANIVGYQANTVPSGWSIITPCFVNVDGTDYKIDDFLLNGVDDTMATVQVMNPDGSWGTQGFWFNAYGDYPAGWFTDATGLTPADIKLAPGAAVMFSTSANAATIQSAGQVPEIITRDIPSGWSMVGNASVSTVAIDEITLIGVEDTMATVQVMNPDGSWGTQGFWFNAYGDYPAGWFTDATGLTPADITLAPGQSVMFSTSASGAKIVLPSALAK